MPVLDKQAFRRRVAFMLCVLLILNLALYYHLLRPGYTQWKTSIECLYIALARFLSCNLPWPSWNPTWFCGYPFRISYTPVLPYSLAVISRISGMDVPSVYRLVTGTAFIFTPMTLYFLARYLSGKPSTALLASMGYSMLPSVLGLQWFAPWRLKVLIYYGEGPHTLALVFTPLALLYFLRSLREAGARNYILGSVFVSLVVLINLAGFIALGLMMAGALVVEIAAGEPRKKMTRAIILGALSYGLSAFWFNVSFVKACLFVGAGFTSAPHNMIKLWPLIGLLVLLFVGLFAAFRTKKESRSFLLILLWTCSLALITFSWALFRIALVPQSNRYVPELDMSFCLLAALAWAWIHGRLVSEKNRWRLVVLCVLILGSCSLVLLLSTRDRMKPRRRFNSFERETAQWFANNIDGEERIVLSGNAAFWANVFVDVPQTGGGLLLSDINRHWKHVDYLMRAGRKPDLIVLWAKVFNVRYILVSYPDSPEPFNVYEQPEMFEGRLEPAYSKDGNVVFEVPLAKPWLILAVDRQELGAIGAVQGVGDESSLAEYVDVVEKGSRPEYDMESSDEFRINTDIHDGEVLLARWNYDKGWRAFSGEKELEIREDPIGFMLIDPGSSGRHDIVLRHGFVWDQWLGFGITGLTVLILAGWAGCAMLRRRRAQS